jgi:hypothetical protein
MSRERRFELKVSEDDENVAYLMLPAHPGAIPGIVKRSVSLHELIDKYRGPDIGLDFNAEDELIGIEIIGGWDE